MICAAKNGQALLEFLQSYFSKIEENVDYKEIEEWKNTLFEDDNTYLFEVVQKECIIGVFHCTIWEDTIHLNFIYCEDQYMEFVYNEMYIYLKENYKEATLEYLFYDHERNIKKFLEANHFKIKTLSYDLDYNGYHPIVASIENKFVVVPFEDKYESIFKKIKSKISKEEDSIIYVVLKKHKPIGYMILSIEEKDTVYIEEIQILPKYEKDIKPLCIKSILKNYSGYDISVIVSYTEDEERKFYESVGFEINPQRIFLEATITL